MEPHRSEGSVWPYVAGGALLVILLAAVRWSLDHPYGIHWDESLYFNDAHIDVLRLHNGMLRGLARRLLLDSTGRPPAYRLIALPVLSLFGFHTALARLVSLSCFGLSCWFLYQATRRIASPVAGAFAVLIFALSPDVIAAGIFFGTDATLYLATSAMLYCLFTCWSAPQAHPKNWIGLGLAIGVGFLSKTSFLPIALPVLAFWLVAGSFRKFGLPSIFSQWKAGAVAFVIAMPWWVLNGEAAMAYTRYARGFVRNSLGPPSLLTWMRWLNTVFQCLLGHGVSVLTLLIALLYLRKAIAAKETFFDPLQKAALGACACAGGPILLAQLSGTNHLLRHISPAVIPLAIVVGILVDKINWGRSWGSITVSSILLGAQLLMLLAPVAFPNNNDVDLGYVNGALPWRTMVRFDQWDWTPVRDIADRCNLAWPKIAFLGSGRVVNPPSIQAEWLNRPPLKPSLTMDVPNVKWLWRYEHGPIDWQKVMDLTRQSDIVFTPPHYVGEARNKEDLDNQHNIEFLNRLSQEPDFQGPIRLEMGRFEPVEMDVFVKKSLACPVGQPLTAKP
jgi:4-amino-4-deoxy-L-arabinose transferase-like glycosyltransferase